MNEMISMLQMSDTKVNNYGIELHETAFVLRAGI